MKDLIYKIKNSTLRKKAMMITLLFIILPAFFYSIYLFTSYEKNLYSKAAKDKTTAIEQLGENIQTSLLSVENLARDLSCRTLVVNLLTKGDLTMYPKFTEKYTEEILLDLKYSLKYQNIDFIDACIYTGTQGLKKNSIFYTDTVLQKQAFYQDFLTTGAYYKMYLLNEEETKQYYRLKNNKENKNQSIILFVQDIRNNTGSSSLGKLILEASPSVVFQPIMQSSNYCIRFNGLHKMFGAVKNNDINMATMNLLDTDLTNRMGSNNRIIERSSHIYFIYPIEEYDLFVIDTNYINKMEYFISTIRLLLILTWVCVMEFIIMQYFIQHTFNSINGSLNEMDTIINNSFSGRIDDRRTDEIGQIAKRYNVMIDHITTLVTDLIKKDELSKQAQSKALQYQINPHFIYNTLSIFAGHAEMSKNYELAEAISYFGHLLRYNLHDNGRFATVRQELENAESLVKIYSIKCSKPISLTMLTEEELNDYKVIKCLLQPILENAILHGQRNTNESLQITIQVTENNENLLIAIEDNGLGMSAAKLKEVQERMRSEQKEERPENQSGSYIGLQNIYERLQLFYGVHFTMTIDSEETVFTRIQLGLPKTRTEGILEIITK